MPGRMNRHDGLHSPRGLGKASETAIQMAPFLQKQGMRGYRVHKGNFSVYDLFGQSDSVRLQNDLPEDIDLRRAKTGIRVASGARIGSGSAREWREYETVGSIGFG